MISWAITRLPSRTVFTVMGIPGITSCVLTG